MLKMPSFTMFIGLYVALACLVWVSGLKDVETGGYGYGQNKTLKNLNVKREQMRFNRHSTRRLKDRIRKNTNAEKLANLTVGMNFLVQSVTGNSEKLENLTSGIGYLLQSERQKQTACNNEDIIQRLESINPLFVSMFVVLADVAFSTSQRIVNNRSSLLELSEMFRQSIKATADRDILDKKLSSVYEWYGRSANSSFNSCVDVRDSGRTQSDEYIITIPGTNTTLDVFCDQKTDEGGWLVIQRRQDGSVDFFRNWTDYQAGFGDISGEFWIGNDNLHLLTNVRQELRVDIMDFAGNTAFAKYSSFVVGPSSENYKLTISGYTGTAGNGMSYHNGMGFSTTDRDNDIDPMRDCVKTYKGCWWYQNCYETNLNGLYVNYATEGHEYINWHHWKSRPVALKRTEMKIRPFK